MDKRCGFLPMKQRTWSMIVAAQKELCRLKDIEYVHRQTTHTLECMNQFEGYNMLRKLNKEIKQLGGNEIETVRKHNRR